MLGLPLLIFTPGCRSSVTPGAMLPSAAAQNPSKDIQFEKISDAYSGELGHWEHYKVSNIPDGDDCQLGVFVDGHGYVTTTHNRDFKGVAYVRYRFDNDDDSRVKTILKAQGLPIKPGIVTYTVDTDISRDPGSGGSISLKRDLRFVHGATGVSCVDWNGSAATTKDGWRPLQELLIVDTDWFINPQRPELPMTGTSDERTFTPFVRKNLAHHVRFAFRVIPHKPGPGPDVPNTNVSDI